ncbi:MAG: hypothetical protein ACI81L_003450 [Verrucomicrobiales bacterium]
MSRRIHDTVANTARSGSLLLLDALHELDIGVDRLCSWHGEGAFEHDGWHRRHLALDGLIVFFDHLLGEAVLLLAPNRREGFTIDSDIGREFEENVAIGDVAVLAEVPAQESAVIVHCAIWCDCPHCFEGHLRWDARRGLLFIARPGGELRLRLLLGRIEPGLGVGDELVSIAGLGFDAQQERLPVDRDPLTELSRKGVETNCRDVAPGSKKVGVGREVDRFGDGHEATLASLSPLHDEETEHDRSETDHRPTTDHVGDRPKNASVAADVAFAAALYTLDPLEMRRTPAMASS